MSPPHQYLLVGLPYSGKTTLALALKNTLGFAHINIDQLKFAAGYTEVGDDAVPDEAWEKIFAQADTLIVKYLTDGKNVANEYAWITKAWRDRARTVAQNAGFATTVIYIKVDVSEIRRRWLENSRTHERFHWPEAELNGYLRDFEEPTADEHILVYDQTIPVDQWIEQNAARWG